MLIYICDDSKSDCLRLMHHLSAYEMRLVQIFLRLLFQAVMRCFRI